VETASKKHRVMKIGTPISIRGPLSKPIIEFDQAGLAVRTITRTAGGLTLSPLNILGNFFSVIEDDGKDPNHPCLAGNQ